MTEKQFQANVVKLAKLLGYSYYHTYDSRKCPYGFPDLVLVKAHHKLVFAELKTEKGKLSNWQILWGGCLKSLHTDGLMEYYIWRPKDWLDGTIEKVLKAK